MSKNEPPEHLHLLSSFELGWDSLNLIYELEPADEMASIPLSQHGIVIAGDNFRASYMLNGRWHHVDYTKGDVAIFPARQLLPRTQVDREVPLIELFLDPAILVRLAGEDSSGTEKIELVPQLHIKDPFIQQMGLALVTEFKTGGADCRLYTESMAIALSAHLLRRYCSRKQEIKDYVGGLPKYKLKEVVNYIHENLERDLSLAEIAQVVNTSPHYFASLFKQSTGMTPHQYVMKSRIEKAKQLLLSQELKLVDICQLVGFQNQSHFTRVFRQHTHTTPKAYRDARCS